MLHPLSWSMRRRAFSEGSSTRQIEAAELRSKRFSLVNDAGKGFAALPQRECQDGRGAGGPIRYADAASRTAKGRPHLSAKQEACPDCGGEHEAFR